MPSFLLFLIPFVSLSVLNILIILKIRSANKTRLSLSNQEKSDRGLARMLTVVVLVFLLCNITAVIDSFLDSGGIHNRVCHAMGNFLFAINCAVNALIYCGFGERFRTIFIETFCQFNFLRKSKWFSILSLQMTSSMNQESNREAHDQDKV